MLRITHLEATTGTVLRVEGRLAGAWVDELRGACERLGVQALELRGLQTVDGDGLMLLRRLTDEGVELRHLSGYLTELMAESP